MAKRADPTPGRKVTREDLERNFRALQGDVREKVDEKRNALMTAAGVAGLVVVILVFVLGRRSGKRKNTIVEIRRV